MHVGTSGKNIAARLAIGAGQGALLGAGMSAGFSMAHSGKDPKSGHLFIGMVVGGALGGLGASALVESIDALERSSGE